MSEVELHQELENLWERMPGESSKVYDKFRAYRDMGPQRSLSKLSRLRVGEAGWSSSALEQLSDRWRWRARTSAWDREQDRAHRQAMLEAIREMAERQAKDGADMQRLAKGRMAAWVKRDPQTGQMVLAENLTAADVARLYRLGFEVERLARGEPTMVTEERNGAREEYDEQHIAAGIAYALAQAGADAAGVEGSGAPDGLPAPAAADPQPVDGGLAVDSGQAEPGGAIAPQPDPEQA